MQVLLSELQSAAGARLAARCWFGKAVDGTGGTTYAVSSAGTARATGAAVFTAMNK